MEEVLIQYGTLGVWVVYMIYKEKTYMKEMKNALTKNTETLNKLHSAINDCDFGDEKDGS